MMAKTKEPRITFKRYPSAKTGYAGLVVRSGKKAVRIIRDASSPPGTRTIFDTVDYWVVPANDPNGGPMHVESIRQSEIDKALGKLDASHTE